MKRIAIGLAILALGGQALAAAGDDDRAPSGEGPAAVRELARGFSISGHVEGLYPGAQASLRLRVRNHHRFPIVIRSITVTAADAASGCNAASLQVSGFRGRRVVRARRAKRIRVPISMLADAADECQNARFPLTFRGKARRR